MELDNEHELDDFIVEIRCDTWHEMNKRHNSFWQN
jgi:hypothetical protein